MPSEIQSILDRTQQYLPTADLARIEAAYQFAKAAHAGQLRFSGKPYITHPVAATEHLLTLQPDEDTIIACLLHDVIEDTESDVVEIEKKFGKQVAKLAAGMEKLGKVRFQGQDRQVENLRKMFVSMATDLRVIFIKLADRLHNMETLDAVRPDKQKRIAKETLEVYAPIAARLGIYEFKTKLEDLAFLYLYPEDYARVRSELAGSEKSRGQFVRGAVTELQAILTTAKIQAEVVGRTKHYYSIWKKMQKKGFGSVDEIYDLFALRVLTETNAECYTTLGEIHNRFTPLNKRFKDYIAVPKINGYQSLHTTVIGLDKVGNQPTEIQIRTHAMHAEAELGAAAHWQYAEKKQAVKVDQQKLQWVKNLVELGSQLKDSDGFMEQLSTDVLSDRIFVLTPGGRVLDLPAGATPMDFAYTVHTEVGHTAVGAKVNGKIAPLDSTLQNGEVVEILTKRENTPNRFWLSFVKTDSAKTKIKAYFNALDHEENIAAGKELLNKQLTRLGKPKLTTDYGVLRHYKKGDLGKREREQLIERIGNGSIAVATVVRDLFALEEIATPTSPRQKPAATLIREPKTGDVTIAEEPGLPYQLAKCCKPKTGDSIAALVIARKGAIIHKTDCKNLARANPKRRLPAAWGDTTATNRLVKIIVGGHNRIGFLRDITAAIAKQEINIADINLRTSDKHEILHELTVEVTELRQLDQLLDKLERVEGVNRVELIR